MSLEDIFKDNEARRAEQQRQEADAAQREREAAKSRQASLREFYQQADKEAAALLTFITKTHYPAVQSAKYSIEHAFITNNPMQVSGQTPRDGLRLYFGKMVAHRLGDFQTPYDADHELRFESSEDIRGFRVLRNSRRSLAQHLGVLPFPIDNAEADKLVQEFIRASLAEDTERRS